LAAFRTVFRDRVPPIYSVKGSIGHTLGAAGGIEACLALRCLAERTAPPTVGFDRGEEETAKHVTSVPEPLSGSRVLVTNSGFGGVSCALILEAKGT
jgi:3-oxoacyl-[acyl-carrier-protein] synthase II